MNPVVVQSIRSYFADSLHFGTRLVHFYGFEINFKLLFCMNTSFIGTPSLNFVCIIPDIMFMEMTIIANHRLPQRNSKNFDSWDALKLKIHFEKLISKLRVIEKLPFYYYALYLFLECIFRIITNLSSVLDFSSHFKNK